MQHLFDYFVELFTFSSLYEHFDSDLRPVVRTTAPPQIAIKMFIKRRKSKLFNKTIK